MLVLVVVLAVTNLVTLGVLARALLRPEPVTASDVDLDEAFAAQRHDGTARTRRLISVEILNPLELARSRGRMAGLAGAIVPNLTTRIVYDQTLKILRHELTGKDVVADVRLHTLRPARPQAATPEPGRSQPAPVAEAAPAHETVATDHYVDDIDAVDLGHLPDTEPRADEDVEGR